MITRVSVKRVRIVRELVNERDWQILKGRKTAERLGQQLGYVRLPRIRVWDWLRLSGEETIYKVKYVIRGI